MLDAMAVHFSAIADTEKKEPPITNVAAIRIVKQRVT
jgi:hypothetical protein